MGKLFILGPVRVIGWAATLILEGGGVAATNQGRVAAEPALATATSPEKE